MCQAASKTDYQSSVEYYSRAKKSKFRTLIDDQHINQLAKWVIPMEEIGIVGGMPDQGESK